MRDLQIGDVVRTYNETKILGRVLSVDAYNHYALVGTGVRSTWYSSTSLDRACRACGHWFPAHTLRESKCLFGPGEWT